MLRTWVIPLCLSLLTAVGLISALLGDGLWNVLSWLALAAPVGLCIYHWARSAKKADARAERQ